MVKGLYKLRHCKRCLFTAAQSGFGAIVLTHLCQNNINNLLYVFKCINESVQIPLGGVRQMGFVDVSLENDRYTAALSKSYSVIPTFRRCLLIQPSRFAHSVVLWLGAFSIATDQQTNLQRLAVHDDSSRFTSNNERRNSIATVSTDGESPFPRSMAYTQGPRSRPSTDFSRQTC